MIRIPILMYHSIDDSPAPACVRPNSFVRQMAHLRRLGYETLHLDAVYHYMAEGVPISRKPIVITFDDGYQDNLQNAYPILKKYGFCATIFVVTDYLGLTNRWNARGGVVQRPLMSWAELREVAKEPLLSFQPHTCSHPRLTQIPFVKVKEELSKSKETLEDSLGSPCHHFAYPYGDFNEKVQDAVKETGYRTACSVLWGHNRRGNDLFSLFRIGVRNQDRLSDFKRILGEPPPLWKYYWLRFRARLSG
ncbi:MAG: polysaccharide deacetylase family protein [Deltaproteobacteria bacterium]|nr:polysaccharide deacetylase family protein [Deltaproteobacteria bacterium]